MLERRGYIVGPFELFDYRLRNNNSRDTATAPPINAGTSHDLPPMPPLPNNNARLGLPPSANGPPLLAVDSVVEKSELLF